MGATDVYLEVLPSFILQSRLPGTQVMQGLLQHRLLAAPGHDL